MSLVIVRLGDEDNIRSLVSRLDDAGFTVPDHSGEFRDDAGYGKRAYQIQVPEGTTADQLRPLVQATGGEILKIEDATEIKAAMKGRLKQLFQT